MSKHHPHRIIYYSLSLMKLTFRRFYDLGWMRSWGRELLRKLAENARRHVVNES